jgi:choline dehydrogenase-like flavoprotein
VVVGGGSAGAVMAARLSEDPERTVILLEAGLDWRSEECPPELRSAYGKFAWLVGSVPEGYQWSSLTAARTTLRAAEPYLRGRGLGGTSLINGCVALRPPMTEFDDWEKAGCIGWGPDGVLPFFVRAENDQDFPDAAYHGNEGPIPILREPQEGWGTADRLLYEAAVEAGHHWIDDANAPDSVGIARIPSNIIDGARITTNDGYLEPIRHRPNLWVQGNALVDKVLVVDGRANSVRVRVDDTWCEVLADEVVLCAGAMASPGILQRSGIGPAALLSELDIPIVRDLPVGQGFQDHAGFALIATVFDAEPASNGARGNVIIRFNSGHPCADGGDLNISGLNATQSGTADVTFLLKLGQCFSRGRYLISSRDPLAPPAVQENLLGDRRDVERARTVLRVGLKLLEHSERQGKLGNIRGFDGTLLRSNMTDEELDGWAHANVRDTAHASSGCPMGNPADAGIVVDPECRVLGVEALRVADASVMPTVTRSNTNLPTIMIAEKVAAMMSTSKLSAIAR